MNEAIWAQYPEEVKTVCEKTKQPEFRLRQLLEWIFAKRVVDKTRMSNIPSKFMNQLEEDFNWDLPEVVDQLDSVDGATKLLLKSQKGPSFEAVILRYENRTSLCVSSQVGCKLSCSFCQTGKLGFFRNLSCGEIIGQFLLANKILEPEERRVTHVVFMGMGEPLQNFANVIKATNLLTRKDCFAISPSRITISTSGMADKIHQLPSLVKASLAISLHACNDELRNELMPINRKFPLSVLKNELLFYQQQTGDKITIEYILIKDKNCDIKHAKQLVSYLHGLIVKINLIPFNPHPGLEYSRPSESEISHFQKYLSSRGYPSPVRYSKGMEVSAACGQLAAKRKTNLDKAPSRKAVVENAVN